MRVIQGIVASLVLVFAASHAAAGEHHIQGRIVDGDGNGVANIGVASAWTKTAKGLVPLEGVETDSEGRFSILREADARGVLLLALDSDGRRGALIEISRKRLAEEATITLRDCVTVKGSLQVGGTEFYPAGAVVWMSAGSPSTPVLRIEPDKSKFECRLPPGSYELTAQGSGLTPVRKSVPLHAINQPKDFGKLVLPKHRGRVATGALAPPIVYAEASYFVLDSLRRYHFPRKLTLCYFWASR